MRAPFADDRFGARLRGHDAHRGSHWSEDFSLSRAGRRVRTQDDLDIVLAVRRTRRLAQELANAADAPRTRNGSKIRCSATRFYGYKCSIPK